MSLKIKKTKRKLDRFTIAIDGPVGAGKSTVAKLLAKRLEYTYLDTGAMYRALTWLALEKKINLSDEKSLVSLARQANIVFRKNSSKNDYKIFINHHNVTEKIRSSKVNQAVSLVAKVSAIREIMVKQQKQLAKRGCVIVEGRDIGSVVLPKAKVKIFLNASINLRAERRYKELVQKGERTNFEKIVKEVSRRDEIDSRRETAPLVKPLDALEIDTSQLSIEEVVDKILEITKLKL